MIMFGSFNALLVHSWLHSISYSISHFHFDFYILMVYVPYDIIVLLFVCMLYMVWLVLDGSLCRGTLLLSSYPLYIMSGFDAA